MFFQVNVMFCHNRISYYRLVTIVFLILFKNISTIGHHVVDTHRLAKRMDLESCLGQFDIHRNTIIRTGESQIIGGKYIQGMELETLEECQRLCCETEGCDVYVFEEKNDGYCYLFQCGPPENFHCKFTRHANYTSAVLTPVKRLPADPTTPKPVTRSSSSSRANISQQEMELTNLKVKPENENKGMTTISPKFVAQATPPSPPLPSVPEIPVANANATTCGRFQFKCHTGECIAVYNACDGIPQCEDGSDEGPECSGAAAAKLPLPVSGNIAVNDAVSVKQPIHQQLQVGQNVPQYQQQLQQQQQQQQQPVAGFTPPLVNNREDPNAWANRKIIDGQQTETSADRTGRIFNHKGGIQVPTNGIATGFTNTNLGPIYAPLPRGVYLQPPPPSDTQSSFRSQQTLQPQLSHIIVPAPNVNWPQLPPGLPSMQGPAYIINGAQPQLIQPLHPKSVISPANEMINNQPSAQLPVIPTNLASNPTFATKPENSDQIDKKIETNSNEEYDDVFEKSTKIPKKKERKHKKTMPKPDEKTALDALKNSVDSSSMDSPVKEQYVMIHSNLKMERMDHDGRSDRPSGAVLSLTFGFLITAALAILISCRMRTVGRRMRRFGGKTPVAQDADFLVNGMYL